MKKTIVALIAIIPLIFMFTVFSVGNVASINVDIAVSEVVIRNKPENGVLYVDIAEYNNDFVIEAEVLPLKASNKKISYKTEAVEGSQLADVTVSADNKLIVNSVGRARVVAVSEDGGYTDSFTVVATASKIFGFDVNVFDKRQNSIQLDKISENSYSCDVVSGAYSFTYAFDPTGTFDDIDISLVSQNGVQYSSSDAYAVINDAAATVRFDFSGVYVLNFTAKNTVKGEIVKQITFNVSMAQNSQGVTVNGSAETQDITVDKTQKQIKIATEFKTPLSANPVLKNSALDYAVMKIDDKRFYFVIDLSSATNESYTFEAAPSSSANGLQFKVVISDFSFDVISATTPDFEPSNTVQRLNVSATYYAVSDVYLEGVSYTWEVTSGDENKIAITPSANGSKATVIVSQKGNYAVTVVAKQGDTIVDCYPVVLKINCVDNVEGLKFVTETNVGLGNQLVIGSKKYIGTTETENNFALKFIGQVNGLQSSVNASAVDIVSSDSNIAEAAKVGNDYVIRIKNTGYVTFTAKWIYDDYFGISDSEQITLYVVYNGIEVETSEQLFKDTEEGREVILTKDILLGSDLKNADGAIDETRLRSKVKETPTTYNWQLYLNGGLGQPKVKYIMEFKNNLYGNGYSINAELFTANEQLGDKIFKGPLSFASIATASVAAQDNIVFLMRTDGVTLFNTTLMSCGDDKLLGEDGGSYDLTKLNYTGTVLDINASVNILNCRVKNGRTGIRIYGGNRSAGNPLVTDVSQVNPQAEKISVTIDGCILSQAREFILKVNSNTALQGKSGGEDDIAPPLKNASGTPYKTPAKAPSYDFLGDEYFMNNYVLTEVTLKDSVLKTSGLFTVGMETNFAGIIMTKNDQINIPAWYGINATSYPSVLRLVGDVRFYDWKNIKNIDSSTLIETSDGADAFLTLDIAAMFNEVKDNPNYSALFDVIDGETYVHGGIAFYGGGKNYSQLDMSDFGNEKLNQYNINISILANSSDPNLQTQGQMLPLAAGVEDFRFYMYDKNSQNDYQSQQNPNETVPSVKLD